VFADIYNYKFSLKLAKDMPSKELGGLEINWLNISMLWKSSLFIPLNIDGLTVKIELNR